jgi:hypothetical protein
MAVIGKTVGMKRTCVLLAIGLLAWCGCAHTYVMKLNNGAQVVSQEKPKFANGAYHYKDSAGKERSMPASRVREIEPASIAKDEQQTFKPTIHKKHHWYFLWIA